MIKPGSRNIRVGSPPPRDGDAGSEATPAGPGGVLLAAAPFNPPVVLQPVPAVMARRPQARPAQNWSIGIVYGSPGVQEAGGRKPAIKYRALIQALG